MGFDDFQEIPKKKFAILAKLGFLWKFDHFFSGFGDFSLNILFIYYIKKDADILITQDHMNMTILERFNKEKLEFAFPTQTIHNIKT